MKDSILQAARIEFAQRGFHGTAVSDVAQRAGVGKETVYRHFGCKEKLLQAVILQGLQDLNGELRYVLNFFSSPIQAVERILEVHVDQYERSGQFVEILIMGRMPVATCLQHELLMAEIEEILRLYKRLFSKGMEQGIFRLNDPEKLAVLYQGFIWSVLRTCNSSEKHHSRKDLINIARDVFLYGIVKQPKSLQIKIHS